MSEPCKEAVEAAELITDAITDYACGDGLAIGYESPHLFCAEHIQRAMEERDKRLGDDRDRLRASLDKKCECLAEVHLAYSRLWEEHEQLLERLDERCSCDLGPLTKQSNAERQSAVVTRSSEVDSQS